MSRRLPGAQGAPRMDILDGPLKDNRLRQGPIQLRK